jgi:hypothetical protein
MQEMTAPLEQLPSTEPGVYRFKTDLMMQGRWQLSLGAKRQDRVSHSRHQSAIDHRHVRVLGLHTADQWGHHRPLHPYPCRHAHRSAGEQKVSSVSLAPGMYVDVPHLDCLLVAAPITLEGLDHLILKPKHPDNGNGNTIELQCFYRPARQGHVRRPAEADISGPQGKSEDQPHAKQILPRQGVSHRRLRCMLAHLLRRHADAGVGNRDGDTVAAVLLPLPRVDRDGAVLRELVGVAHKVQ